MDFNLDQFLGGMSSKDFLKNYWQKKPLLIKGAVPNASELASTENIIEIAQDENFETRILRETGGKSAWESSSGPFEENELSISKNDKWTLMVHNLELYFDDFRKLKSMIDFIPSWQFDDIMSTYSVNGASVGAHIDNYNVFIFQGSGKRQWFINESPNTEYIKDIDVKILSNFESKYDYILEEGDLIYIPPGVAHHGVTIDESISKSIGYKSLDYRNMAS
jgi:50S ribosomal protein L16 3-hydroxylase